MKYSDGSEHGQSYDHNQNNSRKSHNQDAQMQHNYQNSHKGLKLKTKDLMNIDKVEKIDVLIKDNKFSELKNLYSDLLIKSLSHCSRNMILSDKASQTILREFNMVNILQAKEYSYSISQLDNSHSDFVDNKIKECAKNLKMIDFKKLESEYFDSDDLFTETYRDLVAKIKQKQDWNVKEKNDAPVLATFLMVNDILHLRYCWFLLEKIEEELSKSLSKLTKIIYKNVRLAFEKINDNYSSKLLLNTDIIYNSKDKLDFLSYKLTLYQIFSDLKFIVNGDIEMRNILEHAETLPHFAWPNCPLEKILPFVESAKTRIADLSPKLVSFNDIVDFECYSLIYILENRMQDLERMFYKKRNR